MGAGQAPEIFGPCLVRGPCRVAAAATPAIKLAVETMPSLAPEHRGLSTTRYGRRFNSPDAGQADASSIDRSSQIFPSKIRMTTMIKMVPRTPTPP